MERTGAGCGFRRNSDVSLCAARSRYLLKVNEGDQPPLVELKHRKMLFRVMRHSESRLTEKVYTDASHLPLQPAS